MRALTWRGKRDVRIEQVADPKLAEPTDTIVRVTTSGLCGSDLHLYEVLTPFLSAGDVLGHEPMGVVEEMATAVHDLRLGQRVVVPLQKQVQIRMGQANVKRWVDALLPPLTDDDPLRVQEFATHTLPLEQAPQAYEMFQSKSDGAFKVVFDP